MIRQVAECDICGRDLHWRHFIKLPKYTTGESWLDKLMLVHESYIICDRCLDLMRMEARREEELKNVEFEVRT